MKPVKLLNLLFCLMPLALAAQNKLNYRIFYNSALQDEGLLVELSFTAKKAADSTFIHYSGSFWGEDSLFRSLLVKAEDNPQYRFRLQPDSNRIVLYHARSRNIIFRYRIRQDFTDNNKVFFRPRVQDAFFHMFGQSLFAVPDALAAEESPTLQADIRWEDFPADFCVHNTFGSGQLRQQLKVKLWDQLYHSAFIGGDYRIRSFTHHNKPVYFAIRGAWLSAYADEDHLFEALKKTIAIQRGFWKDDNFPYYTVVFSPMCTQNDSLYSGQSVNGTAVHGGFVIQSSNNPFNNGDIYTYMLYHEMTHDWIGGRIPMKNEELNYWFSEGFTDYYTYKNRLRSGDFSLKEWQKEFGEQVIWAHWQNPERNRPNYVVRDQFWTSRNVSKVPYRRGAIFAFWLDNRILKKSGYTRSLDDLMRKLLKTCVEDEKQFSDELFLNLASEYLGEDISYEFQKYVLTGEDIPFAAEDLIDGFSVQYEEGVPWISATPEGIALYLK